VVVGLVSQLGAGVVEGQDLQEVNIFICLTFHSQKNLGSMNLKGPKNLFFIAGVLLLLALFRRKVAPL
jgi:hypothetical protein